MLAASRSRWHRPAATAGDITPLMPLAEAVPSIHDKRSRPRQRRQEVLADRGYDHDRYHRQAWAKGIKPVIARRGTEHGLGLGARWWVVAQTIALRRGFRRLRIRREIHDHIHEALMRFSRALICWRRLASVQRRHS